jgi:hypothetical protein
MVDPVPRDVVAVLPWWTQATLPGFASAPVVDAEGEQEPATVRAMACGAEGARVTGAPSRLIRADLGTM